MPSKTTVVHLSSTSATSYEPSPADRSNLSQNATVGRSRRYGDQAYFWTEVWQQGEKLANFDYIAGMDYEPKDLDDLFDWLDSNDE